MKKLLFNFILPPIVWLFIHLWCKTLRCKVMNPELEREIWATQDRLILTVWHSQYLYPFYHFRGLHRLTLLVSPSVDGDLLAIMCQWFGYSVVRGSSFKKTIAGSRDIVKLLKKDLIVGIIADGSRGPRNKAQLGSLQMARITGAPIYPMAFDAQSKYEFRSWDRFVLPLPFSRVTMNYGPAITVPPNADKQSLDQKQEELNQSLNRITQACVYQ